MRARELNVAGAFEFTSRTFPDERGLFASPYEEKGFAEAVGHPLFPVAQASHSVSRRGVVRGVHVTAVPPGQAQYVYCVGGRAVDIIVDTRVGSPTYGRTDSVVLGGDDCRAVYYPVGVGHAFVALEDDTVIFYLLSTGHDPENEFALSPMDTALALPLPKDMDLLLSERDTKAMTLAEAERCRALPEYAACRAAEAAWR
ncbi:dTDP-4-dehydrorhamnose 3,5-epimerase family protein [Streptomyces pimonensis]|uniref:dTDP-4-dehydrorhamnose 3,5-epimerase family protein n=1 Tax=Streptomyces pimonensis TaxID=2860288 RepID=A0ABV4J6I1_9ACTN